MPLSGPVIACLEVFPAPPPKDFLKPELKAKVNGTTMEGARAILDAWPALHGTLHGPTEVLGSLQRDGDDVVTWKTADGTQGATRFTIQDGQVAALASRWTGL